MGVINVVLLYLIGNCDGVGSLSRDFIVGQNCPCLGPDLMMLALFFAMSVLICLTACLICLLS